MTTDERFARLEASHVQLMTDHEVFLHEQEKAWERNRAAWERHEKWLAAYEAQREKDRADARELDARISRLVSVAASCSGSCRNERGVSVPVVRPGVCGAARPRSRRRSRGARKKGFL